MPDAQFVWQGFTSENLLSELPSEHSNKSIAQYADLLELIALTSADKQHSLSLIEDSMEDFANLGGNEIIQDSKPLPNESNADDILNLRIDESTFLGYTIEPASDSGGYITEPTKISKTEFNDRLSQQFDNRCSWGDHWPFQLNRNILKYHPKSSNQHNNQYIALLLCANLRLIKHKDRPFFTGLAEALGYHATQTLFPQASQSQTHSIGIWQTLHTGAAQLNQFGISSIQGSNNPERLKQISQFFHLKTQHIEVSPSGDSSMDIVSAQTFNNDARGRIPQVVVQVACSAIISELERKTADINHKCMNDIFALDSHQIQLFITPQDLWANNTKGFLLTHMNEVIMIDRGRFLQLLEYHSNDIITGIIETLAQQVLSMKHNYYT